MNARLHLNILLLAAILGSLANLSQAQDSFIFWTDLNLAKIQRSNLDGSDVVDLFGGGISPLGTIAADRAARKIYWPDAGGLLRADFDGQNLQTVIPGALSGATIELDGEDGKMYWGDNDLNRLRRADLGGSKVEDLFSYGNWDIFGMALDTDSDKMYVATTFPGPGLAGDIRRYDLEGSMEQVLISGMESPRGLALDLTVDKLYWVQGGSDDPIAIRRMNLDGSNPETVPAGLSFPEAVGIDPGQGKIIWTENFEGTIRRCNLDGSSTEILVSGLFAPSGIHLELDLAPPEIQCRIGNVNSGSGLVADVLFVNGSAGDATRVVEASEGDLIWAAVLAPPAAGNGKFVVHANMGEPIDSTVTPLPAGIGDSCFPLLLSDEATPAAIWNGIGKPSELGESEYFDGTPIPDPDGAPELFLLLWSGDRVNLPIGTTVTLAGVIIDPASLSPKGGSVTNAAILKII